METADQVKHKRHRGGRPVLPDSERRRIKIQPSFTVKEFEEVEIRAEALGLSVSEWLRVAAMNQTIRSVPMLNKNAYLSLNNLAINLNSLAHAANINGCIDSDLLPAILATRAAVQALRSELLGRAT